MYDGLKIGFIAPSKITNAYININSLGAKPLYNSDGSFAILDDDTNIYYVAKYNLATDSFLFMGYLQPLGVAYDDNVDSPFYINGTTGIIPITLYGGEYDNIYTNELAQIREEWELYTRCKIKDSITLTLTPIYWLEANKVIEITLPNKYNVAETNKYIIKQINTGFGVGSTQTVTAMRYYPEFSNP